MTTNQPYSTRRFSATEPPRIGQRVRLADAVLGAPVGTLCDVLAVTPGVVRVVAYVKTGDAVTPLTLSVLASALESVRGKPYIPGIDLRRRNTPEGAAESTVTVAEPDDDAPDADIEGALETLREAMRRPKSAPVDLAPVVARIDALEGEVVNALERCDTHADALDTQGKRLDALREGTSKALGAVDSAMDALRGAGTALEEKVDALADALASAPKSVVSRAVLAARIATGREPILAAIARYYTPGVANAVNVLLCTAPSLGKSFAFRKLGASYDRYMEHGCSEDADEVGTLLGSPIPDGRGGFLMVDGVVTQAMRDAASGLTVLLLMDEVLRLAPRAQEWLLTFLTGYYRADGTKWYRLRTRRALADGTLEVVECPATHLHIAAATNLGMAPVVEAFWSRWLKVRVEFSPAIVREVAANVCDAHGIADSGALVDTFADIVCESREKVATGALRFPVDIRVLVAGCAIADDATGKSVAAVVGPVLADQVAHWNIDMGDALPESVAVCETWARRLAALAV